MPRVVQFEGKSHQFPDDATDDEVRAALDSASPSKPLPGTEKTGIPGVSTKPQIPQNNFDIFGPNSSQMTRGIVGIGAGSVKRGASDLIEGMGGALSPFAVPAAIAAPAATLGAAALGYGGQKLGEKAAEKLGGDEETQRLTGDLASIPAGMAGGKIGGMAGNAAMNGIAKLTKVDPAIAMTRALKPNPSDSSFQERVPSAVNDIAKFGGKAVKGNEDLIPAAKGAIKSHQDALEQWLSNSRNMNAQVSTDPIVHATEQALPQTMQREDPASHQAILQQARQAYGGKSVGVDDLRQLLREKNAELNAFYNGSQGRQGAAVTSGAPQAVVKAQRDAIADSLYHALDPENGGAGPREIQKRTGDITNLLDAAEKRRNAIIGEKPVSQLGAVGKVGSAIMNFPGRLWHGQSDEAFGHLMHPIDGPSDALIKRTFGSPGEAAPIPQPTAFRPAGLLGPAPIPMGGQTPQSGPVFNGRNPFSDAAQMQVPRLPGPSAGQPGGPAGPSSIPPPPPQTPLIRMHPGPNQPHPSQQLFPATQPPPGLTAEDLKQWLNRK